MSIKPIRNAADFEEALAALADRWGAAPGTRAADEGEVLAILIDKYEQETFPIEAPTPLAAIQFRLEQLGLSRADLAGLLGSRSRAAEVLAGARALSVDMMRRLRDRLHIPADVLLGGEETHEYEIHVYASKPNSNTNRANTIRRALNRRGLPREAVLVARFERDGLEHFGLYATRRDELDRACEVVKETLGDTLQEVRQHP